MTVYQYFCVTPIFLRIFNIIYIRYGNYDSWTLNSQEKKQRILFYGCNEKSYNSQKVISPKSKFDTVILSDFRKTSTKDRIGYSLEIPKKETANQTVELISNKNKDFFIFILEKVSSYSTRLLRVLLKYYTTRPF